jgi:hypothetical protein
MSQYLKIENCGVAPVEGFTVLGASTTSDSGVSGTIGKFGSGNKHSVNVCLRNKVPPIVFCGTRRLEFFTRPQVVNDGLRKKEFARVCVKNSGKDDVKTYNSTDDLGFVLDYGAADWTHINLALREFVANAIDRSVREAEHNFAKRWCLKHQITEKSTEEQKEEYKQVFLEHTKTWTPWTTAVIEVVEENQVRAQKDKTRVFIPLNDEVFCFYQNLGKYFLHFREPSLLKESVFPKRDRNLTERRSAVIYKQGVMVREVQYPNVPSLFDYNLNELKLDESRTVDDWVVKNEAAKALAKAPKEILAKLMSALHGETKYWELDFDVYSLGPQWDETPQQIEERSKVWGEAFQSMNGENAVLSTTAAAILVTNKGYKPVAAPESFVQAAAKYGIKTAEKILTQDDLDGRVINEATPAMVAALDFIWTTLEEEGLTLGKTKPEVKGFKETVLHGSIKFGFYRDGVVYLNDAYCPTGGYANTYPPDFLNTVLHEAAHHITQSLDNSTDFEGYAFKCAIHFMLKNSI